MVSGIYVSSGSWELICPIDLQDDKILTKSLPPLQSSDVVLSGECDIALLASAMLHPNAEQLPLCIGVF